MVVARRDRGHARWPIPEWWYVIVCVDSDGVEMVEGKQQEIEFKICSEYWYLFEPLQKLKFPDGVADHPIRTSLGVAHFLFLIQGRFLCDFIFHSPTCYPPPIFCNSFFKSSLVYFRRIFHLTALVISYALSSIDASFPTTKHTRLYTYSFPR